MNPLFMLLALLIQAINANDGEKCTLTGEISKNVSKE